MNRIQRRRKRRKRWMELKRAAPKYDWVWTLSYGRIWDEYEHSVSMWNAMIREHDPNGSITMKLNTSRH